MGALRGRTFLALTSLGALALLCTGCESTQSESARLGREGAKLIAGAGTVGLGGVNRAVRVGQVALVQGSGRTAAAVRLVNTGAGVQAQVPVLIDVLGAKGVSLYRNDTQGLEPSLQRMPLLGAHTSGWWVDDQVLASGKPQALHVQVGAAKGTPGVNPAVQISGVTQGSDLAGPYLAGEVTNRSKFAQHNMPIFAVGLRGGRVVAAGRALVPNLAPAGGKPAAFRIYLVGSPAGAHIELTAAPAVAA